MTDRPGRGCGRPLVVLSGVAIVLAAGVHAVAPARRRLTVRRFTPADLEHVVGIDKELFESQLTGEILLELLIYHPGLQFVAAHADKVVGYITCRPENGALYIPRMGVHPDHRQQGVGRLLLERVFAARDPGQAVELHVRASNSAAIRLYEEHFGFEAVDEEPDRYGSGQRGLKMRAAPATR